MEALTIVIASLVIINVLFFIYVYVRINEAKERDKRVRHALRDLCAHFGFEYDTHWNGDISIRLGWGLDRNKNPIQRKEFEERGKWFVDYLRTLEKYLGVKLQTIETPAKTEQKFIKVSR